MRLDRALSYDCTVAEYFMFGGILVGLVGMAIGGFIGVQMAWPGVV